MNSSDRFLGRAEVYAAARPTYPAALLKWLQDSNLLTSAADIGAGTGLFTQLLLQGGAAVTAVEPNPDMRAQLTARLAPAIQSGHLTVRAGTSEATGLPDQAVALITATQAAHWFAPEPTVQEFRRVLVPGGSVLLVWNDWRGEHTPFNDAYGQTIRRFYRAGDDPLHLSRVPEQDMPLFMPGGYHKKLFGNPVPLTRERLHALAGSISSLPLPQDPLHAQMTAALDELFDQHQQRGQVMLHYRTHAFLGRV